MKRKVTLSLDDAATDRGRKYIGDSGSLSQFLEDILMSLPDPEVPHEKTRISKLIDSFPEIPLTKSVENAKLDYLVEKYVHD